MEIAFLAIILAGAHLLMFLMLFIVHLAPFVAMFLFILSIIGITIFIVAEYFKDKYLYKIMQKIIPDKIDVQNSINKAINIVLMIIKICISLFNYAVFAGSLLLLGWQFIGYYYEFLYVLLIFILSCVIVIFLKIFVKKIKVILSIFFLLEPCILSLIMYLIVLKN
jgi:hypothetical protein